MPLPIYFSFAGLAANYCIESPQRFAQDIAAGMQGNIDGTLPNYGDTEPSPANRSRPWLRTVAGVPDRWYVYSGGFWVWPNARAANSGERMWWADSEANLWLYDGGDGTDPSSNAPTATTGAMWVRDTDYDGKVALAAGTLPSGATVAIGATGGEDVTEITIGTDNLPPHRHYINVEGDSFLSAQSPEDGYLRVGQGNEVDWTAGDKTTVGQTREAGGTDGEATVIEKTNLPPYRAGFWAKRSARTMYVPV